MRFGAKDGLQLRWRATVFPLVDTRNYGAAAAVVLDNPAAHAGKTYALTGPVAHSYDEVQTALATFPGHAVTYKPITPEEFEPRPLAAGIPDWRAFDLAHIASAYSAAGNAVSPDLPMLLGPENPGRLPSFSKITRTPFPPDRAGVLPLNSNPAVNSWLLSEYHGASAERPLTAQKQNCAVLLESRIRSCETAAAFGQ